MLNALTFDVEEWYHGNLFNFDEGDMSRFEPRVVASTCRLLDVLSRAGTKATFFFLGVVARDHPELVRRVAAEGHEIGCHGWSHRLLYTLPEHEVKREVSRAKALLEDICGVAVRGFRAPSWSINSRTMPMLRMIEECGFEYDSSLFPEGTPVFGVPTVRVGPTFLTGRDTGGERGIVEFPPATLDFRCGLRVPFGGGVFLRLWPYAFVSQCIRNINSRGLPTLVYLHPWEFDSGLPGGIPLLQRIVRDVNICSTEVKLRRLISDFKMGKAIDVLKNLGLVKAN